MKDGYVRVAAATPVIKVADCIYNQHVIMDIIDEAYSNQTKVLVLPELCITGYTCNDLFLQDSLIDGALEALVNITAHTKDMKGMLIYAGVPIQYNNKLYNTAAVILEGKILALCTKKNIPNYGEFYEMRHFNSGMDKTVYVTIGDSKVPMGNKILLRCTNMKELVVGCEICEDLWVPMPPSIGHAMNGATIVVNCSASNETVGKDTYRKSLVGSQSASLVCGYIYSSCGEGESTQDLVFGGHNIIAENGSVLAEAKHFHNETIYADMDVRRINSERRRMTTFKNEVDDDYTFVDFTTTVEDIELQRFYDNAPFVPKDTIERKKRCEYILDIQTMGLKKRLAHTGCKNAVVGISGGLDSTLALIVIVRAFDSLGLPRSGITSVTMPCFGTTDRTYTNAVELTNRLGATLREIDIKKSVTQHFEDISHDSSLHNVTYENGQARERTQILMDIANQMNGMVIGTGDMSELALGWATYNGDHMSMYGVNASVPKTLVRHLVRYYADTCDDAMLSKILYDVLDTPVSPELLPPNEDGTIAQKTEDLVGPYELHDFFMYHILRFGIRPAKLYRIAKKAFAGEYDDETILKWMKTFYRRFFSQQFKRSCLPDGPKVGSVAVSPRGDLRMPSDASAAVWMKEIEEI